MKKYAIRDREAGNVIEFVDSMAEGEKLIREYEESDKEDGTYEENFYECVCTEVYTVFGVGGDRDGETIYTTNEYYKAIKVAKEHEDEYPLGVAIIDQDGKDVEW